MACDIGSHKVYNESSAALVRSAENIGWNTYRPTNHCLVYITGSSLISERPHPETNSQRLLIASDPHSYLVRYSTTTTHPEPTTRDHPPR